LCTLTCATRRGWMRCSSRRSMLCSPLRRCIGFRRVLCAGYTAISLLGPRGWSGRTRRRDAVGRAAPPRRRTGRG
jgi:hypothetical protein